jgi:epoxyqueuosine reductase
MGLAGDIKQKGLELGFDAAGVTDTAPIDNEQFKLLTDWVAFGYAGRMNYMRDNLDKRTNPAKLLEGAQSVICVGLNYKPPKTQKNSPESKCPMGRVANYAQYEDYHQFIKNQLHKLVDFISSVADGKHEFRICVDSVPLAERALAVRAGLGFIGKSHMLINPGLGPQILLGEIITNLKLQTDGPISDTCRSCNKCIEACPTGALRTDGRFDANKCISYLTIEYKGQISADLAEKIGDRLFGCDECVLACPYQENAPVCRNKQFKFYSDRAELDLGLVLDLTEDDFETEFADSPIKRLGLDLLKRNAKICLGNAKG